MNDLSLCFLFNVNNVPQGYLPIRIIQLKQSGRYYMVRNPFMITSALDVKVNLG